MSAKLAGVEPIQGGAQVTLELTFEHEGTEKPVCVAETLARALRGLKQPRQLGHVGEHAGGAVEPLAPASCRRSRTRSSRRATPASTPAGESSTTAHSPGSQPIVAAACRNRSGAGLPCSTSWR